MRAFVYSFSKQMVRKLIFILVLSGLTFDAYSQGGISVKLSLDTVVWDRTAYLSFIPDLDNMYTISNEMIIDRTEISDSGSFTFDTKYLPDYDVLLRLHISKKGDLPASLIIGGKDENHFFFVANNRSRIIIEGSSKTEFTRDIILQGYSPNQTLFQINKISSFADTVSFNNTIIKSEFVRGAIFQNLRSIADTCTNPLVALYALYKSNFERNYSSNQQFYKNFLTKWRHENSEYFNKFRDKIPSSRKEGNGIIILIAILSLVVGIISGLTYTRLFKKKSIPIQNLSVQERKIFALLLQGKSNKEISESLTIGLNTVKTHVNSIYSKLDVKSRKEIMNLDLDEKKINAL